MARYIDADALKTDILKKYKQNWEVPCSYEDRIIQRVVTDLRVLIEQNTPADVVPKSEVDRLQAEVKVLTENSITSKYPCRVSCSNGLILTKSLEEYDKMLADIANEVAREIVEIINDRIDNIRARTPYGGRAQGKTLALEKMRLLETLKVEIVKKYTEGKKDDRQAYS